MNESSWLDLGRSRFTRQTVSLWTTTHAGTPGAVAMYAHASTINFHMTTNGTRQSGTHLIRFNHSWLFTTGTTWLMRRAKIGKESCLISH